MHAHTHKRAERGGKDRAEAGGGGKWVRSRAVTWSCWLPRFQQPPPPLARPPPPPLPAAPARLRGGRFNPSPAAAAAAATAATSGTPRRCCLALVRVSHSPAPGSGRESPRVRKSSIQKSQVPACLLLPAPPLLRSALFRSALLFFFFFLRPQRLLLLPGALSVPELLLRFSSSSSFSSLSLLLPSPFTFFFFFLPFLPSFTSFSRSFCYK